MGLDAALAEQPQPSATVGAGPPSTAAPTSRPEPLSVTVGPASRGQVTSTGQLAAVPSHTSLGSHASLDGRHETPAVSTASPGQSGESPRQTSGESQPPPEGRQIVATRNSGTQSPDVPVQ